MSLRSWSLESIFIHIFLITALLETLATIIARYMAYEDLLYAFPDPSPGFLGYVIGSSLGFATFLTAIIAALRKIDEKIFGEEG